MSLLFLTVHTGHQGSRLLSPFISCCHPSSAAGAAGWESPRDSTDGGHSGGPGSPGHLPPFSQVTAQGRRPCGGPGQQGPCERPLRGPEQELGAEGLRHPRPEPGSWARREGRRVRPAGPGVRGYLHDRLRKVPRAPVAEACLHRGRDEALVSCSVVRVVGGLPGERTETHLVTSPHLLVPHTANTAGHFCAALTPVSWGPRDRAPGQGSREPASERAT